MSTLSRQEFLLAFPGLGIANRLFTQSIPPVSVQGLHSVTLAVSDIGRSLEFYQGLFGMPIQARHRDTGLLRIGDSPSFVGLTPAGRSEPRIDRWGMSVQNFDPEAVIAALTRHGVRQERGGIGLGGGPHRIRSSIRGSTPEIHMGDLNGLVIQLQDPTYCGGNGPLGATCENIEPAPTTGDIAVTGMSHLTINVPDPQATNAFYQRVFGTDIQAYQAASPLMGVGTGVHFLMFVGSREDGNAARVGHACLSMENFDVEQVQAALERHGIEPRDNAGPGPLRHWISMRMPNRGGAPEGTPELYFSDPDGLSIQIQDVAYCGGGGYLGGVCT